MDAPSANRAITRLWRFYLAVGVSLTVWYFVAPAETANMLIWPLIGWTSVLAIFVGVRVNRPTAPLAWYLIAGGAATQIVGDGIYSVGGLDQSSDTLFVSYSDILYLAMYPLVIAGLVLLVRRRTAGRDRAGLIDAAIIAVGIGVLSWVLLIAPYARLDDLTVLERVAAIAYPVGDIALLATAVRLAVGGGRRPVAFWLLAASLVAMLASDTMYSYFNLTGEWQDNTFADNGHAVPAAIAQSLDDGPDQGVDDHFQPERRGELFGNQRQRGAGGL